MFDMMKMMGKFKEAQDKMKEIKNQLDTIKVESESGAGLVKVEVNGKKEVISIKIDKSIINEVEMVEDLTVAAVNKAMKEVEIKSSEFIKEKTGANFFLESGFNSDKKASARNMIMGRGHSVISETTISHSVIRSVLDANVEDLIKYQEIGPTTTRLAGTEGCHLHVSNALTAIYLATGQDTACVAENSIGHYQIEPLDDEVKFRLTLPSLTVGTVGGGTRLAPQQQNLKLLGCDEGDNASKKFAEIICASALALEISLFSALASHTFAQAHMKYGR